MTKLTNIGHLLQIIKGTKKFQTRFNESVKPPKFFLNIFNNLAPHCDLAKQKMYLLF